MLEALARSNPADGTGYLMLAREMEVAGDLQRATRAYAAALAVAPVDRDVLMQGAARRVRAGDTAEALQILAGVLEQYDDAREKAFPVMAASLASGRDAATWKGIVARDPKWLGAFVVASCRGGVDPAVLLAIFLERASASKATVPEVDCMVGKLRDSGRWEQAYAAWLETLPRNRLADVGYVFNGGFEYDPIGEGFDWIVDPRPERDSGYRVEFVPARRRRGGEGLASGLQRKRQAGSPIAQYLALPPGRYAVSGTVRSEGIRGGHGVQWVLRCALPADSQALASSPRFASAGDWREFSFDVTVAPGCRGQRLQLDVVTTDGVAFLAGVLWFDNLAIRQYH